MISGYHLKPIVRPWQQEWARFMRLISLIHVHFERGTQGAVHLGLCFDFIGLSLSDLYRPSREWKTRIKSYYAQCMYCKFSKTRCGKWKRLFIPVYETSMTAISFPYGCELSFFRLTRLLILNHRELITLLRLRLLLRWWLHTVIVLWEPSWKDVL